MPRQNVVTRLDAVAAGLGDLADELEKIYGEPTANLRFWQREIMEVVREMAGTAAPGSCDEPV